LLVDTSSYILVIDHGTQSTVDFLGGSGSECCKESDPVSLAPHESNYTFLIPLLLGNYHMNPPFEAILEVGLAMPHLHEGANNIFSSVFGLGQLI